MKKLIAILIIISSGYYVLFSQTASVNGFCYLENNNNHSGSKVVFEAFSPGAEDDSVYTDNNGFFEIDINIGVYKVSYSHEGYITFEINENIAFLNDTTLPSVTLDYGSILEVSGLVSGVWSNDYVYHVVGDVDIIPGDTLIIEPGTLIKFMGDYMLDADGYYGEVWLFANGTPEEKITFTSGLNNPQVGDWNRIYASRGGNLYLSHANIEYSKYGVNLATHKDGIISNCIISHCNKPIWCKYAGNYLITNNIFLDNTSNGFDIQESSPLFLNNLFCGYMYLPIVNLDDNFNCRFYNNLFLRGAGFSAYNCTGGLHIENNFFAYNSLYVNEDFNIPYIGEVNTVNINGDSCDLYFNLFNNPLLINSTIEEGYSWEYSDVGDSITFYLNKHSYSENDPPSVTFSNDGGLNYEALQMQWIDDHFEATVYLYYFGATNPPINFFGFGYDPEPPHLYEETVDFLENPFGPKFKVNNTGNNYYIFKDSSPAIDAGKEDIDYNDLEDPLNQGFALYPAKGTLINDIGVYGGPSQLPYDSKPIPDYTVDTNVVMHGNPVQLTNLTEGTPYSYFWQFPEGVPESSNEEHPSVVYENSGFYDIRLSAENANGSNSANLRYLIFVIKETKIQEDELTDLYINAYPNPLSYSLTIEYDLFETNTIDISIYNQLGELIYNESNHQHKGRQKVMWQPNKITSGLYFIQIHMGDRLICKKIIVL